MRWILGIIVVGIIISLLLIPVYFLAGPAGLLLGLFVTCAIGIRFASYLGLFSLPAIAKQLTNWTVAVGLISVIIIWATAAVEEQIRNWFTQSQQTAPAQILQLPSGSGEKVVRILLRGENKLSNPINTLDYGPGTKYFFEGPESTVVHFYDGTFGPISKWYGIKGGRIQFSGPAGQEVIVRFRQT